MFIQDLRDGKMYYLDYYKRLWEIRPTGERDIVIQVIKQTEVDGEEEVQYILKSNASIEGRQAQGRY